MSMLKLPLNSHKQTKYSQSSEKSHSVCEKCDIEEIALNLKH